MDILLERSKYTTENLSLDSECSGLDSNLALPEHKSDILPLAVLHAFFLPLNYFVLISSF
jgi:hypothetical protein